MSPNTQIHFSIEADKAARDFAAFGIQASD
jgi:hypothetical protein